MPTPTALIDETRYGVLISMERCAACDSALVKLLDAFSYDAVGSICPHPACLTNDWRTIERED